MWIQRPTGDSGPRFGKRLVGETEQQRWLVITVESPSEESIAALAEGLIALGGSAVEETAGTLRTYVPEPANPREFLKRARGHLGGCAGGAPIRMRWRWQVAIDWSRRWRRGLRPRRVGAHLVVSPGWLQPELRAGDRLIVVDPEMAFGTGEHASTRGALRLLEAAGVAGGELLDVGTGSGILAIAAVQLGARSVLAVDNDPAALVTAQSNLERNGVADRVRLAMVRVDPAYLGSLGEERFDGIAANILSSVLCPLLPALRESLRPQGRLILAGILREEAAAMIERAASAGLQLTKTDEEDEWWSGLFTR